METAGTILYVIVGLVLVVFMWRMLIDAFKHKEYGWAMFIIFFNIVGAITYYFAIYKLRSPYDRF